MKALLVIDMQNVSVGENHAEYFKYDNKKLIDEVNKAIDRNSQNVVVYIRNIMKRNFMSKFAPFKAYEGTEEVELVENLHIVSEFVFDKYSSDAFTNKKLSEFLKSKNIDEIEIVGVDGGGCVSLTAMGAIKNKYKVTINKNAIGTMYEKQRDKYFRLLEKSGARFI